MKRKKEPSRKEEKRLIGCTSWQKKYEETTTPIGTILASFLSGRNDPFEKSGKIGCIWKTVIPQVMQEHCRPTGFEHGILTVEADAGPYLYQLQLLRGRILEEVREKCPRCGLRDIRIIPGKIHTQKARL
jgi:hypothetical protein